VLVLARDLQIFDGPGKLPRPRLDFLEESRVLDGDNGLIGEGIDKLDLTFGERANLGAPDEDRSNCLASVDQRDREPGARTGLKCSASTHGVFILFGLHVCDLNRSPLDDGTSSQEATPKR